MLKAVWKVNIQSTFYGSGVNDDFKIYRCCHLRKRKIISTTWLWGTGCWVDCAKAKLFQMYIITKLQVWCIHYSKNTSHWIRKINKSPVLKMIYPNTPNDNIFYRIRQKKVVKCGWTYAFHTVVMSCSKERSSKIYFDFLKLTHLWPISCAMVKAEPRPMSSLMLQLLSGSHIPATEAKPE